MQEMSVLIQGMEMPKPFDHLFVGENLAGDLFVRNDTQEGDDVVWYQLIEVQPHGRLIDADALEDFVIALKRDAIHAYEWTGKSGEWNARIFERERFAQAIENAPTIIQADKEG